MYLKVAMFSVVFCTTVFIAQAQRDTTRTKPIQYLGVQANQLVRQIFNLSNSNSVIDNPYLLTYSVNSAKTGHGLNVGLGYSVLQTTDGDAITKREITDDQFSIRIGYEKKSMLSKRWMTSLGVDVVIDSDKNKSKTTNDSDFNKSTITSTSKSTAWGLGPRFTLSYSIHPRIFLGTEANYYLRFTKDDLSVDSSIGQQEFDPNTGTTNWVYHDNHDDASSKGKKFKLNVPAVIFLIVKF